MYKQIFNCVSDNNVDIPPPVKVNTPIEIKYENKKVVENITAPEVWGESFWFVLHLGSVHAPDIIPIEKREKYWNFIDGLPEMVACQKCSVHAREWVENNRPHKDMICSSRENLITFFVNMHNNVNVRNGKPLMTVEEVKRKFSGSVTISSFSYD